MDKPDIIAAIDAETKNQTDKFILENLKWIKVQVEGQTLMNYEDYSTLCWVIAAKKEEMSHITVDFGEVQTKLIVETMRSLIKLEEIVIKQSGPSKESEERIKEAKNIIAALGEVI